MFKINIDVEPMYSLMVKGVHRSKYNLNLSCANS